MELNDDVVGDEFGKRVSGVSGEASLEREVSYAIVMRRIWRNMMRKSRNKSCSLEGTCAVIVRMVSVQENHKQTGRGHKRRTESDEIENDCSGFHRLFARVRPNTAGVE